MKTINDLFLAVFTTNGDAVLVENEDQAQEVKDWLDRSRIEDVRDEEDFNLAAAKLDFNENTAPRHIYAVRNDNPNDCGYIVFAEDYD